MSIFKFQHNAVVYLLGITAIVSFAGLIFGFYGSDVLIHSVWTKRFSEIIALGNFDPGFDGEMFAGYGSYIFYFYPPLTFYIGSALSFFGNAENYFIFAVFASAVLAVFCSAGFCYLWIRENYSKPIALICGFVYVTAPYFLVHNFYMGAAMGSIWAYAFMPLVLMGTDRVSNGKKYGFSILTLGQALLFLTNIPAVIIFSPFAFIYGLIICKGRLGKLVMAHVLAAGLAAFYLFPMLILKGYANITAHWGSAGVFEYKDFFFPQLFLQGSNFVVVGICSVIMVIFIAYIARADLKNKSLYMSLAALFMASILSYPLWKLFPILQIIQFPYRYLDVAVVFAIPLVAVFLNKNIELNSKKLTIGFILPFVIFGFFAAQKHSANLDAIKQMAKYQMDMLIEAYPFYLPKVDTDYMHFYNDELENFLSSKKVEPELEIVKWENDEIELRINKAADEIVLKRHYFPLWIASIEGKKQEVYAAQDTGKMVVKLDKSYHNKTLKIKLPISWYEKLGYIVSALSLLALAILFARGKNAKI